MSATIPSPDVGPPRRRRSRLPGAVRFYVAFSAVILVLVGFEGFLTSLPFADAIPDYAQDLQQRQLDSYFEMIQLLITLCRETVAISQLQTNFVACE